MFCLKIRLPHVVFFAKFDGLWGLPSCSVYISAAGLRKKNHRSTLTDVLGWPRLICTKLMVNKHVDTLKPTNQELSLSMSQQSVFSSEKPGFSGRNPIESLLLHFQHLYLMPESLAKVNHQTACLLLKAIFAGQIHLSDASTHHFQRVKSTFPWHQPS